MHLYFKQKKLKLSLVLGINVASCKEKYGGNIILKIKMKPINYLLASTPQYIHMSSWRQESQVINLCTLEAAGKEWEEEEQDDEQEELVHPKTVQRQEDNTKEKEDRQEGWKGWGFHCSICTKYNRREIS